MSNIKPKKYAEALANALSDKNVDEKVAAKNFVKLLQRNADLKKTRQILALASMLLLKKTGNRKIVLETARPLDSNKFAKSFVKKGDLVEEKINPSLIAGVKIIVDGEKQLDFSLLKKIESIF
jgi:F0F1-type ATP synthase delta subunit